MGNESYHLHLCMWKGNWKQPSIYIRKPFLELGWNVCRFVGLLDNFHMTCNVNISDKPKISVILRLESYWFSITISCTNMKERRLNRYNSSLRAFFLLQRHSMASWLDVFYLKQVTCCNIFHVLLNVFGFVNMMSNFDGQMYTSTTICIFTRIFLKEQFNPKPTRTVIQKVYSKSIR